MSKNLTEKQAINNAVHFVFILGVVFIVNATVCFRTGYHIMGVVDVLFTLICVLVAGVTAYQNK